MGLAGLGAFDHRSKIPFRAARKMLLRLGRNHGEDDDGHLPPDDAAGLTPKHQRDTQFVAHGIPVGMTISLQSG